MLLTPFRGFQKPPLAQNRNDFPRAVQMRGSLPFISCSVCRVNIKIIHPRLAAQELADLICFLLRNPDGIVVQMCNSQGELVMPSEHGGLRALHSLWTGDRAQPFSLSSCPRPFRPQSQADAGETRLLMHFCALDASMEGCMRSGLQGLQRLLPSPAAHQQQKPWGCSLQRAADPPAASHGKKQLRRVQAVLDQLPPNAESC